MGWHSAVIWSGGSAVRDIPIMMQALDCGGAEGIACPAMTALRCMRLGVPSQGVPVIFFGVMCVTSSLIGKL